MMDISNRLISMDCSENQLEVIRSFIKEDEVSGDHYKDGNMLYRLAGYVKEVNGEPVFSKDPMRTEANICKVLEILNTLKVRPSRVFVHEDWMLEVDWYPRHIQICKNKEEYFKLNMEFVDYLDSIEELDIRVQTGMYNDDPDEILKPSFNEKNFDRNEYYREDIEVINAYF